MLCGVGAQQPCDEGDRSAMGFELAGRQVDDQSLGPAVPAGFKFGGHQFNVRRTKKWRLWIELIERSLDEAHEVVLKNVVVVIRKKHGRDSHGRRRFVSQKGGLSSCLRCSGRSARRRKMLQADDWRLGSAKPL